MPEISKKNKKFIKRNFKQLSIEELSRKTELKPNNEQRTHLRMHTGTARVAYNWGLAYRKELYEQKKETINAIGLHKELNKLKKEEFE